MSLQEGTIWGNMLEDWTRTRSVGRRTSPDKEQKALIKMAIHIAPVIKYVTGCVCVCKADDLQRKSRSAFSTSVFYLIQ